MIHRFTNKHPTNFFSPPYRYYIYEEILDINVDEIKNYILSIEKDIIKNNTTDGDGRTGLGDDSLTSRHNSFNLFKLNKSLTNQIKKHHNIFLQELSIPNTYDIYGKCWANVMKKGEKVNLHRHSVANYNYLSGNICIKTEKTHTYYRNPYYDEDYKSENIPGKITIFPSWIEHYTDLAVDQRITIAFDLVLDPNGNNFWVNLNDKNS